MEVILAGLHRGLIDRSQRHCQSNSRLGATAIGSPRKDPVPSFQKLAGSDPAICDDVQQIRAVAAQR